MRVFLLIVIHVIFSQSCYNNDGMKVDWWVSIKFPPA